MSLRDQIINASDCQRQAVEVTEWTTPEQKAAGQVCTVYVRNITAAELDSWQCETYVANGGNVEVNRENIRCRLLIRSLVDEAGQRIFADNEAHLLGAKNTKVVERLYKVAEKLNAVTSAEVEELAKNS
jgi:hypothetical protein